MPWPTPASTLPNSIAKHAARLLASLISAAFVGQAAANELSREALLNGHGYLQPLDLKEYTPALDAPSPIQHFEGRLTLTRQGTNGYRSVALDRSFLVSSHRQVAELPNFDFEFVADGGNVIPVRRGTIPGRHPAWEIILEPGRVWEDAEDGGYARVALPFALEERNENCMHNGVLTFLFKSDGSVSHAAWQISSETCRYEKFDAWGWLRARYLPHAVAGAGATIRAFHHEVAVRMPVRPIAQLAVDHPGAVPANFGAANEVSPDDMSTYGFVIDGVHYTGGCPTRHGSYPFCATLDLPSYSLAKSMVAGIALMRLEHLYSGAAQSMIRAYVPECATEHRWDGVSFLNVLDMATGLYRSAVDQEDEDAAGTGRFFFPTDHAHKIRYACHEYQRRAAPGTTWVYHTSDTYVLGVALQRFLQQHRGPTADFYRDLLVEPLWKPLGLSPSAAVIRRTYDAAAQPFTGYGLTLHSDDIVKLALFLSVESGRIDGQQALDPMLLRTALQQDPNNRGLPASTPEFRYAHGFWAYNAARALGCADATWVPFMSGFGGIEVVMLPNRTVYYYVSDGGEFRWAGAAAESNRIRSFCPP